MLLLAAGLLFGGMCFFVPLPWLFRTVLVSAVLLATVYYCLRYALLKLPNSLVALHINNKNQLQLVCKDGQQLEALVQANTVVTGYLTAVSYTHLDVYKRQGWNTATLDLRRLRDSWRNSPEAS